MWNKGTFINITKYFFTKHRWHYWLFNNACIVVFSNWAKINGLIQVRRYPVMWAYGQHYCVEIIDLKRGFFDCGVMVYFKQSSWASSKDKSKKLLSWIIGLSNVVFLYIDGMRHLRGCKDMIPTMDYFLYIPWGTYRKTRSSMSYQFIVRRYYY